MRAEDRAAVRCAVVMVVAGLAITVLLAMVAAWLVPIPVGDASFTEWPGLGLGLGLGL